MRFFLHPLVIVFGLLVLASAIGIVVIGTSDLTAPTKRVEKVIPSDRLPR